MLATKVYGEMGDWPNDSRLSARHIRAACEASLRRLKTDHVDLYQMHHVDRDTPWEELWQAMELLVQQGKVIYVGSSNFAGWHIARANEAAARRNFLGLVSEQSKYSLVERTVELEVLPACAAYGMGVIPYSPLASGALAGSGRRASKGGRREGQWAQAELARHRPKLEAFERFCANWARSRLTWRWPGYWRTRWCPAPSSGRARASSWTAVCARWRSGWMPSNWRRSTRCSPGRASRPRKPTPGDRRWAEAGYHRLMPRTGR